jgi:hypothetical protein
MDRVVREIFVAERREVTCSWRKSCDEDLRGLLFIMRNTGVIKVVGLWVGSVARIGEGLTCLTMKICSHNVETAHMLQRCWLLRCMFNDIL